MPKKRMYQIEAITFAVYLKIKEIRKELESEAEQRAKQREAMRGKLLLIRGEKPD